MLLVEILLSATKVFKEIVQGSVPTQSLIGSRERIQVRSDRIISDSQRRSKVVVGKLSVLVPSVSLVVRS